jgi:hypothetical protein
MTADDRHPVADHLALKLWEPDPLAAVELHERLTTANRRYHGVRAAVNLPPGEVHEPECRIRVISAAARCSKSRDATAFALLRRNRI